MIEQKLKLIKIGETYLKFDFEYNEANKERVREAYMLQIDKIGREFLNNREFFKISIEFDQGSLKARIVVWGTILYFGIADYGSFRGGLREIINDVLWFSENVIELIDDGPNISQNDIIRTEKRTGLTGRIKELYDKIDRLERNVNKMSNVEIQNELQQIKQEVSNLSVVLPNQDGKAFLADLDNEYTKNLPSPDPKRVNYLWNRYGLKSED